MRLLSVLPLLAVSWLAASARPVAWGFEVHRLITDRAMDQLPEPIRPFFQKHRAFIVEHSIDPDLWRTAGWEEEPPRHFLDLDEYGAAPFPELPRDYDRAVQRYGAGFVRRNGVLPWRTAEVFGELRRTFDRQKRGAAGYTLENVKFHAAVLAHYVADAHVPLHAVKNYDGQLTGQHGIHGRWETELILRPGHDWRIEPGPVSPVSDPRAFMFDALVDAFPHAEQILEADRAAAAGRDTYDNEYFERLAGETRPLVERQLSKAVTAVASMIAAAWEAGGRPDLPLDPPRRERPVRRPARP